MYTLTVFALGVIVRFMATGKFGSSGEWWVVAQFILVPIAMVTAVFLRNSDGAGGTGRIMAIALALMSFLLAAFLAIGGVIHLGHNLTAVPRPLDTGVLVQTGVYAIVRHPIYAGIIFGLIGWGLVFSSLAGLVMAAVVLIFFDLKSRREEKWLIEKYPDYAAYRSRVRKLIPFIY